MGKGTPLATNEQVAAQFDELGDRLLLEGESWFKVSAYRRAAVKFRDLQEDLAGLALQGRLRELPGVGEAIASKVEAYLESGHIPALDRLRTTQPAGLLRLWRETGLAPKLVRHLAQAPLGIDCMEDLVKAVQNGSLDDLPSLDAASRRALTDLRGGRATSEEPTTPA